MSAISRYCAFTGSFFQESLFETRASCNMRDVRFVGGFSFFSSRSRLFLLTLLGLLCLVVGCGRDGPERVIVAGKVTYKGQPIKLGQISFFPTGQTMAPMSGSPIIDGRYLVDAKGGVVVGAYKVEVRAYHVSTAGASDPLLVAAARTEVPGQQLLPAKFNAESTLTIEVPSGSDPITRDFELSE